MFAAKRPPIQSLSAGRESKTRKASSYALYIGECPLRFHVVFELQ